jgi:Uma2 family endonuclease
MATPHIKQFTAEDLEAITDDTHRYDLIRGELWKVPPASPEHGIRAGRVHGELYIFVKARDLGEVFAAESGFKLHVDPDSVLAPDVAFVRRERLPGKGQRRGFWTLVPDLVVEVMSPSDSAHYVAEKVEEYLEAGVPLVWVLNPRRETVTAYGPGSVARILRVGDVLDGGDVLPGFTLPVANIFR